MEFRDLAAAMALGIFILVLAIILVVCGIKGTCFSPNKDPHRNEVMVQPAVASVSAAATITEPGPAIPGQPQPLMATAAPAPQPAMVVAAVAAV